MDARAVVVVAYDHAEILDITGPAEVFAMANWFLAPAAPRYDVTLAAAEPGPVTTSGGLQVVATTTFDDLEAVHTLVVPGGLGVARALADERFVASVARLSFVAERIASVCTGAFVLAAAGLLDGRRAATHWNATDRLARWAPTTAVDPDAIFVRDGNIATSAGVTAGIDLALAFVEDDHGRDVAANVAKQLVVFLQRPGGQSQFSMHLRSRLAERGSVRRVQHWIADNLAADLSVPALAAEAGMSVRNFARVFRHEVGVSPAAYVEAARVEAAKRLLESTAAAVGEVAHACGFRSADTFHRVFRTRVGVAPGEFRRRFSRV